MVAKSELVQLLYYNNIIIIYTLTTLSSCEESCGSLVNRNLKMKCDQFMTLYFQCHLLMAIGPSSNQLYETFCHFTFGADGSRMLSAFSLETYVWANCKLGSATDFININTYF